jgi:hypothetical protein
MVIIFMNNAAFGIVDFTRIALNESNYSNSFFLAPCFIRNSKDLVEIPYDMFK